MPNIYLIGFMGSGKSTLGILLSNSLNFNFIDTDELIEKRNSMSISNIFKTKGELFFRNEEKKIIKEIIKLNKTIVSTGGGMPCFNNNIETLNKYGKTIYLDYDIESLYLRLKEDNKRPLLSNKSLKKDIQELLNTRRKIYNKCNYTILCKNLNQDEVLREINSLIISK
jgi:shikimate kinase